MAMDPISTSPLPLAGGIRPAQALQSDLSSVLRQGRIVAGEVLELLGGGTIVIGLAGQRVQAENHIDLAPGDRFLARVEYIDGELVLQLTQGNDPSGDALLRALRSLAGSELDARSMRELLEGSGAGEKSLPAVFQPEQGGAGLATLLRQSGLFQEGVLRSVATDERIAGGQGLALDALAARILRDAGLADAPDSPALLASLRAALAAGLDEIRVRADPARALEAALQLRGELVRQLGVHGSDPSRALLRVHLAGLAAPELEHSGWLPWVALLLGERLAFSERGLRRRALVQLLQEDFKARLAVQSQQAGTEVEREAASRVLRALEAEQLRNVARARLGEPLHIGFLVPEGAHTANAHLFVPPRREGAAEPGAGAEEQGERVTLGVEFSRLGALRAEILLQHDRLHVRLGAARPESVALLRGALEALERQLAAPGREIKLAVVPHEPGRSDPAGADLAYLRQHHLMDLSG